MTQPVKSPTIRRWIGDSKNWLSQFLDAAPSDKSIVAVIVMGSVVRERGHRRSDFDLLVLYRGKRPAIKAPLEVDIRFAAVDHLEEQISEGHEVVCWALQFGSVLYDPEFFWNGLQNSWAGRVPLPSAVEAHARGEKSLARAVDMLQLGDESAADDLVLAALTQFARERLIKAGVFPASRPELPNQLRELSKDDRLAHILDDAMFGDSDPTAIVDRLKRLQTRIECQVNST